MYRNNLLFILLLCVCMPLFPLTTKADFGNFNNKLLKKDLSNAPGLALHKQYTGKYGVSSDGFGSTSNSGEITAYIPKNSIITSAYLYSAAYTIDEESSISIEGLKFNSKEVTFEKYYKNPWKSVRENYSGYFLTGRSNVTSEIKDIYESNIEFYTFSIAESNTEVDGEALVIVYYNDLLPETTIAIIDGGASIIADQILISFPSPLEPSLSSFFAELYLGINFSCCNQSSNIFVNENLITENAGNHNDGMLMVDSRGSLITVGGHNDTFSPHLPSYDEDTEKYDIKQYISAGSSNIKIETANTSGDDNLFLIICKVYGSGTVEIPCSDSDSDGVIDQWDKCPNTPSGSIISSFGCPVVLGDLSKNDKLGIEDSIIILQTLANTNAIEGTPSVYFGEDLSTLTQNSNSRIDYPNSIAESNNFIDLLGNVGVENFESYQDNDTLPLNLSFDGNTMATINGNLNQIFYIEDSMESYQGQFPISGHNFLRSLGTFSIAFEKEQYAFGFFVTDYEKIEIEITFENINGQFKEYKISNANPSDSGSVAFWGIIDNSFPFSKVTIIGGSEQDGIAIDNLIISSSD